MNKRRKYIFNREIKSRLKDFGLYLKELGQHANTIGPKLNYTGYFLNWLESEGLPVEEVRYNDLLGFIGQLKGEGKSTGQINRILSSIRDFYQYLKREKPEVINPASGLQLRGTVRKVIGGRVDFNQLETLYDGYRGETLRCKRNRVILGLLIYQGVTTEELALLESSHLKLQEGKIYVRGGRRRNGRTLELKAFQVLELHEYLTGTRPQILNEISFPRPSRKPDKIDRVRLKDQLLISIHGSCNIKHSLLHLFRDVQKINPSITSAKQIRQSAITYWLKTHNLRQVQYMAGHKYVSSTERYQTNNLDSLQSKLERLHPLNDL